VSHSVCIVWRRGGESRPEGSGTSMIARLLLALLTDALLDSVVSKSSFSTEMSRYLKRRGLTRHTATKKAPAR